MQKFTAEQFVTIGTVLQMLKEEVGLPPAIGDPEFDFRSKSEVSMDQVRLAKIVGALDFMARECQKVNLKVTLALIDQLRGDLGSRNAFPKHYVIGRIAGVEGALRAEMQQSLFLHIDSDRQIWYEQPRKEWEEVIRRFPKTATDVEEASRCFACDRYAGAIFHAMQIAEVGAIEVGRLIEINDPKPGWPSSIREMKRIVQKENYQDLKPVEQRHRPVLEQLLPLMESIQDAWRHKISHVENKLVLLESEFTPQIAEEILIATRAFMRRLATDLPLSRSA